MTLLSNLQRNSLSDLAGLTFCRGKRNQDCRETAPGNSSRLMSCGSFIMIISSALGLNTLYGSARRTLMHVKAHMKRTGARRHLLGVPTPVRNDGTEGDAVNRRDEYRDGITDQTIHSMVRPSARKLQGRGMRRSCRS